MSQAPTPPRWVLALLAVSLVFWPWLLYWLPNSYSGWSELRRTHDAGRQELANSQGRTHVTLVHPSGRRYDFASEQSGQATFARTEVGFDDGGFWVRGARGGWTGGPRGAVYIPWSAVRSCDLIRVNLASPPMSLVIQDQPLADACACQVAGRC
jgi:hypothetical protein